MGSSGWRSLFLISFLLFVVSAQAGNFKTTMANGYSRTFTEEVDDQATIKPGRSGFSIGVMVIQPGVTTGTQTVQEAGTLAAFVQNHLAAQGGVHTQILQQEHMVQVGSNQAVWLSHLLMYDSVTAIQHQATPQLFIPEFFGATLAQFTQLVPTGNPQHTEAILQGNLPLNHAGNIQQPFTIHFTISATEFSMALFSGHQANLSGHVPVATATWSDQKYQYPEVSGGGWWSDEDKHGTVVKSGTVIHKPLPFSHSKGARSVYGYGGGSGVPGQYFTQRSIYDVSLYVLLFCAALVCESSRTLSPGSL